MNSDETKTLQEEREIKIEEIKNELYASVLRLDWKDVVEIYRRYPEVHTTKITFSGDTAMHVAINHGIEDKYLVQLFDEIAKITSSAKDTLRARNELGNTPLHCAAWRGFRQICNLILGVDESLVFEHNKEGETPLFLAALNCRKEAFLYLHSVCVKVEKCPTTELRKPWRRQDGDTILHATIQREYFDLAFQIIHLYKEEKVTTPAESTNSANKNGNIHVLATAANEKGITPLHVLASKPSAFKSATRLQFWGQLLYPWLRVERLEAPSKSQLALDITEDNIDRKKHPEKCCTCFTCKTLHLSGYCIKPIRKIKQNHVWGAQIMDLLLESYDYRFVRVGSGPPMELMEDPEELKKIESMKGMIGKSKDQQGNTTKDMRSKGGDDQSPQGYKLSKMDKKSTPLLIATKYGLIELVSKILSHIPVAIYDRTSENKNAVLVAVEKRQPYALMALMRYKDAWDSLIQEVDIDGNNALHLAAKLSKYKSWEIPGSAMQMQWEIKWYQFVQKIVPQHLNFQTNKDGETPDEIFEDKHKDLVKESVEWLKDTSESCSLVAILIAGVTFASSITIPGGTNDNSGLPILEGQPAFKIFAIASLIALCFSITSLLMFLAILTSRKQPTNFFIRLPSRLLVGFSSMFVSIASMLVSFCIAHSFVLEHRSKHGVISLYTATCLPVLFYAISQFPLYFELVKATFKKVPEPSYVGSKLYAM